MCSARHHGAGNVFTGLEQIVVFQEGDHLAGGDVEGFVLRAGGDKETEIIFGISLFDDGIIKHLGGNVAVPDTGGAAFRVGPGGLTDGQEPAEGFHLLLED